MGYQIGMSGLLVAFLAVVFIKIECNSKIEVPNWVKMTVVCILLIGLLAAPVGLAMCIWS